jgi:hypothetical protein
MRCSVREECRGIRHVEIERVQVNSKLASAFWQRQLKYFDLSHKNVKHTNNTCACTVMPVLTQKDSTVHGKVLAWASELGGGGGGGEKMKKSTDCFQNISF